MPEQPTQDIPVGLATILGVAAAAAQYVTALVVVLASTGDERLAVIAPLVTATATLVTTIRGRMGQAEAREFAGAQPAASTALRRTDLELEDDGGFDEEPQPQRAGVDAATGDLCAQPPAAKA